MFQQARELIQSQQFIDRLFLIGRILKLMDSAPPRIKTIMTINRNELKKIAGGRTVMKKYYSTPNNKGGFINSSG